MTKEKRKSPENKAVGGVHKKKSKGKKKGGPTLATLPKSGGEASANWKSLLGELKTEQGTI